MLHRAAANRSHGHPGISPGVPAPTSNPEASTAPLHDMPILSIVTALRTHVKTPPPTFGWTPSSARLRNKTYLDSDVSVVGRAGLDGLPPELWQAVLHFLPIGVFWQCRSVRRAWKAYIESYLLRRLLAQTSLFLQVDTRPSFDFFGTFLPQEAVEERWLMYRLPQIRTDDTWWNAVHLSVMERTRLSHDAKTLILRGTPYGIHISIAGFLGDSARALRVRYDEKERIVRVDWRVLLCTLFGSNYFKYTDHQLSELMYHPGHDRQSTSIVN